MKSKFKQVLNMFNFKSCYISILLSVQAGLTGLLISDFQPGSRHQISVFSKINDFI